MRTVVANSVLALLTLIGAVPATAGGLWTLVVVGGGELSVSANDEVRGVPTINVERIASQLSLAVDRRPGDLIALRDTAGAEWRTANGSALLEGAAGTRALSSPALVTAAAIYLPLDAIAELSGRRLVIEDRRAFLLPLAANPVTVRAPDGWDRLDVAKTPDQLAEMRRLDETAPTTPPPPTRREVLPSTRDALVFDIGAGVAGRSGASELGVAGGIGDVRVNLNTFVSYGPTGVQYRSGRLTLREADGKWLLEAGDLISNLRGVARGVRVGKTWASWWRPSIGAYAREPESGTGGTAFVYRDELQLPREIAVRSEVTSDRSTFVGAQWAYGPGTLDTFWRRQSAADTEDRGASLSLALWKGITGHVGARITTGSASERWYTAGLGLPVANRFALMLERTRTTAAGRDTSAVGLQVPIGQFRLMQRYQWTDVALVREPALTGIGYRQLQSTASYSPVRRIRLSYQLATQWSASNTVRQWTELDTLISLSRATSLHVVTGLPDVTNPQRLRFGLQQNLPRQFRLLIDYGHLSAFQSAARDGADHTRFMVSVRRSFSRSTRAGGADVHGRVVTPQGEPVAGATVNLGPYVAVASADGSYRFSHVPSGSHALSLDAAGMPAPYTPDGVTHQLETVRGADLRRDLIALRLHSIRGHVYVDRNANGTFDSDEGVSGVVVQLSATVKTLTDQDGAYGFHELLAQRYVVAIDTDRLSRELTVMSDGEVGVTVEERGGAVEAVDFRVAPKRKPIVMQEMSTR